MINSGKCRQELENTLRGRFVKALQAGQRWGIQAQGESLHSGLLFTLKAYLSVVRPPRRFRCEEVPGPTADLCSFASLSLEDLACEPHSTSHGSAGALFPSVVEELV